MLGSVFVRICCVVSVPVLAVLTYAVPSVLLHPVPVAIVLFCIGSCCGVSFPDARRSIIMLLTLFFFAYCLFAQAGVRNVVRFCYRTDLIVGIEGTLVDDSSYMESGGMYGRMVLEGCRTRDGSTGSARGVVSVCFSSEGFVMAGTRMVCSGSYDASANLFQARNKQVCKVPRVGRIRNRFLVSLANRLRTCLPEGPERALAMMLLLGKTTDDAFPLKKLSIASGCAHLLALSGMHLQIFAKLSAFFAYRLFGKAKGRFLALVLPLCFVFLAGPKPSLLRALGMMLLFLPIAFRPFCRYAAFAGTALLQVCLFPSSLASVGFLLSYVAYGALLLASLVPVYCPKPLKPFFDSLLAVSATAPVSLAIFGSWQPIGIVIAPVAALAMDLAMYLSVAVLVCGPMLSLPLGLCRRYLVSCLTLATGHPSYGSWTSYLLFLMIVLTTLVGIGYAERTLWQRRKRAYELELRLRFPCGNRGAS